jgi:hypothetical protein
MPIGKEQNSIHISWKNTYKASSKKHKISGRALA